MIEHNIDIIGIRREVKGGICFPQKNQNMKNYLYSDRVEVFTVGNRNWRLGISSKNVNDYAYLLGLLAGHFVGWDIEHADARKTFITPLWP